MRYKRGQTARGRRILIEALEARTLLAANPLITEFMASNAGGLLDGNGARPDWVEIQNQGDQPVNLVGWHLTDNANDLDKWTFPSKTLNPGQFLVVFASGNDAVDPAGNLHTNFLLDAGGEYLALTRPDGSVASAFGAPGTDYPNQLEDISFGTGTVLNKSPILNAGAPVKVHVPANGSLNTAWVGPGFNDSGWTSGTSGVGYDTGGFEDVASPAVLKARWAADSLGLSNGQVVNAWTDSVGGKAATGAGNPTYQANVINGHAVVRFNPADGNDHLRVLAANNPMANAEDFTIAVVFRTNSGGAGAAAQWYNNTGIVDAEVGGVTNDWGLAINSTGQIGAGLGGPDVTMYSSGGNANGGGHVALYTVDDGAMRLYVDGGNGTTASGSPAGRVSSDMVFGSLQTSINYFNGDIAEIVIFQGEMDVTQAHATMNELGSKYAITIAPPATPPGPALIANWTADDLNGSANNATVWMWNSSVAGQPAINSGPVSAPELVKDQINGHSVVRFNPTDGEDQLRVSNDNSPMSSIGDFTMAVVFKTAFPGVGGAAQWWSNSGIVDAEIGGVTNDWGLAINSSGQIGGGIGSVDATIYSGGGLANGNPHVAVFSRQGGNIRLTIDGSSVVTGTASAAARGSMAMVFGSLQTNLNYYRGDIAEVRVYSGAMSATQTSDLSATLATTYAITLLPGPYDALIGTDVQAAMHTQRSSAYLRVPFTVSNPAQYDRLFLNMRYDDGFVAYLNGTEVARRNAPGSVAWNSTSVLPRADDLAVIAEEIDISAFAHLLANGSNVLAIHGLNSLAGDPDFLVVPELVAATSQSGGAYFSTPTPGAANAEGFADYVRDVNFSVDRGIYSTAQNVQITTSTAGASIVYTMDGSVPTLGNGIIVHAADASTPPIANVNVNKTTTLRATAFKNTHLPTNVDTQTYIFIADILTQGNVQPSGAYWDTEMDPNVVNASQTHSVANALTAIPTMSLVLPNADIFGSSGIYPNPTQRGRAWERAASVEYFDPSDPLATFQIDAGLRIQGGVIRDPSRPKKSFRLFFREEYGKGKLEFPIFGEDYVSRFDHLVLRAGHNYAWANAGGTPVGRSDYLRDQMSRDLHKVLTGTSSAGDFVHLYINGLYWGLYNVAEQIDEDFAANHLGGDDSEYDVLQPNNNGGLEALAGKFDAWNTMFSTADAAMASGGSVDGAEYAVIRQYLDVTNLADYMINIIYRGDADAPTLIGNGISPRNFYAVRRRVAGAGYQFFTWDGELSMDNPTFDRTETAGNQNPARLYQQLRTNAEFRQLVADRVYKHFFHEGVMRVDGSKNAPRDLFQTLVDKVDKAIVGESARWGDAKREPAGMRDTDWLGEINWLKTTFFAQRSATVLNQLRADFAVLNTLPAEMRINGVAQHGGQVTPGAALTLVDTGGSGGIIYYTLDGSDPRLPGGGIFASALTYTGAIPLNQNRTVLTRIRVGSTWSPLNQAAFTIHTLAAPGNIVVSELNYNPLGPTAAELAINPAWQAEDFEYIELYNPGGVTVDLLNAEWVGITHTLGNLALAPGQRGVLVKNPAAFAARYGGGITILGAYGGNLSNNGEAIKLEAVNGAVISEFTYSDSGSWPGRADGDGSSLEFISGDPKLSGNWRSSYEYNGTPGAPGIGARNAVVVNEVLSNTALPALDAIELHNTTAGDINIGGWFLSDSNQYKKFRIPDNTIFPAGGYLVFDEDDFNPTPQTPGPNDFALDSAQGDDVWLTRALANGELVAFEDSVHFDAAPLGQTIGRVPNGSGRMYRLATSTLGGANSAAAIGPVIISEMVYAPASLNDDLEYIEIQNISAGALNVGGWMFDRGVQFTFAGGTMLEAREPVLIVHFDPGDLVKLNALRAAYGIDPAVRIFGPYTGSLDDLGEEVRLARPDMPPANDPTFTPFVLVDAIDYGVAAPWPVVSAVQSLSRKSNDVFANDPANWSAGAPNAGQVAFGHAYFQGAVQWTYTEGTVLDSLTIEDTARVNLPSGRKTLRTSGLAIGANARLDLNDGFLIVDGATLDAVNGQVRDGRIISSAAVSGVTAVGVSASSVEVNAILARWTVIGDANLDATVDHTDFNRLYAGFGQAGGTWSSGDFNYSGKTDFADFQKLEQMFGQSLPAPAMVAAAKSTVKKPIAVAKPAPVLVPKAAVFASKRINRELLK